MMKPDSGREKTADFLEVERRMMGIGFQDRESAVRQISNRLREGPITLPELRRRVVAQSFVD